MIIALSLFHKKLSLSDYHDLREVIIALSRSVLGPSTAPCSLYVPQPPLQPFALPLPSVLSTALCPSKPFISSRTICLLYGPLPPLGRSVPSKTSCPLYCSLYPLWPCPCFNPLSSLQSSVPSTSLYSPLWPSDPLWRSAPSMALCSLYDPLSIVWPSILSMALCFLNSPLSSLPPSVSSTSLISSKALCSLYRSLSPLQSSVPRYPLYSLLCPIQAYIVSMDLCSLNSPLSPLWLSVPLRLMSSLLCPPFVFRLHSHCFYFPLSPPLVSPPLFFSHCVYIYALCLSHLVSLPLSFPSVSSLLSLSLRFSSCLFPLSLPLSFPFVSPYVSPLSLFSLIPTVSFPKFILLYTLCLSDPQFSR